MSDLREVEGLSEEIRALQNLFQEYGFSRPSPRCYKIQLVI